MIASWLIYCFIISSAYAGNLKAFLTTKIVSKPINTLEEIINGGLPWKISIISHDDQLVLQETKNPTLQKIWKFREHVGYLPAPEVFILLFLDERKKMTLLY